MRQAALLSLAFAAQAADSQMRAGTLVKKPRDHEVHFEDLQEVTVPSPGSPSATQVLVQVYGSSVNPVDWKLIESDRAVTQWTYPHVFGRDCAGVVLEVGSSVSRFIIGDAVWADNASPEGCYAEFVLLEESITGHAPRGVPLEEAAVFPLAGLTAKQAFDFGGLPGATVDSIVVLGGSGGVGHIAVQMARAWAPEARIVTTCSNRNLQFCDDMGADLVIDYHKQEWQNVVPPLSVDIVFDTVGLAGTGDLAYEVLKDGGSFATLLTPGLASNATADSRPSVRQEFFLTDSSDWRELDVLKEMVESGKLWAVIDKTFPISEIAACFNHSMDGHTVGKVSVVPVSASTAAPPPTETLAGSLAVTLCAVGVVGLVLIVFSVVAKRRVQRAARDPTAASGVGQSLQPLGSGS